MREEAEVEKQWQRRPPREKLMYLVSFASGTLGCAVSANKIQEWRQQWAITAADRSAVTTVLDRCSQQSEEEGEEKEASGTSGSRVTVLHGEGATDCRWLGSGDGSAADAAAVVVRLEAHGGVDEMARSFVQAFTLPGPSVAQAQCLAPHCMRWEEASETVFETIVGRQRPGSVPSPAKPDPRGPPPRLIVTHAEALLELPASARATISDWLLRLAVEAEASRVVLVTNDARAAPALQCIFGGEAVPMRQIDDDIGGGGEVTPVQEPPSTAAGKIQRQVQEAMARPLGQVPLGTCLLGVAAVQLAAWAALRCLSKPAG